MVDVNLCSKTYNEIIDKEIKHYNRPHLRFEKLCLCIKKMHFTLHFKQIIHKITTLYILMEMNSILLLGDFRGRGKRIS